MASRYSVARAARQWTSAAAKRPSPFACQQWRQTAQMPRLFTVSAQLKEKKYTEDHEWIEMSADGKTCTLGISEYAAKALGDVVYIELPEVDLEVSEGDAIGAVESVKSASDILTPISGTVAEVNEGLQDKPSDINKDPEGEAWIARIAVSEEPAGKLMSKSEYTEFTEEA
ncbi:glycine cleavage system H-protein subunit [Ascochyta rabiei]|uniref:Glycine cleavage system H protein n=1 Tax=Didymella rabiei TaxID=5454 RepID=A0A163A5A5_DIDRA|nr:glycine cleavage system H-protein subunit [Ascochyta rabiei]KZM20991.1 glycine decarboxylation via glycine cleavage system [Ascochyta rabiei]UPX14731.1 glycine cleavage system H-protein subunit [Ascochyta rabiei]